MEKMELDQLYHFLKQRPRDARWMLRKVGSDYLEVVEQLNARGWPVDCHGADVGGQHRMVFAAADQGELFAEPQKSPRRRRRRPRAVRRGRIA